MDRHSSQFLLSVHKIHGVTEDLELNDNIVPATVVQALGAVLAKYTVSQPNPDKAIESFVTYFKSCVAKMTEAEKQLSRQEKQSEF
jgi:hypothetical protein